MWRLRVHVAHHENRAFHFHSPQWSKEKSTRRQFATLLILFQPAIYQRWRYFRFEFSFLAVQRRALSPAIIRRCIVAFVKKEKVKRIERNFSCLKFKCIAQNLYQHIKSWRRKMASEEMILASSIISHFYIFFSCWTFSSSSHFVFICDAKQRAEASETKCVFDCCLTILCDHPKEEEGEENKWFEIFRVFLTAINYSEKEHLKVAKILSTNERRKMNWFDTIQMKMIFDANQNHKQLKMNKRNMEKEVEKN